MHEVRAVVVKARNEPAPLETVLVPDPGPGEALAGATTIVAVDIDDEKLETARRFGTTHTANSRQQEPVAAIRELTGGFGADVVIDAVGIAPTFQQAFEARGLDGFVSERIGIEEVEPAFEKMTAGKVLRSVVEIAPSAGATR